MAQLAQGLGLDLTDTLTGDVELLAHTKGVTVRSNDDGSITIELHIVVDHGVNLAALSESIMNEVSYKVSSATNVPVRQVNVFIDSMILD